MWEGTGIALVLERGRFADLSESYGVFGREAVGHDDATTAVRRGKMPAYGPGEDSMESLTHGIFYRLSYPVS